MIWHNPCFWLSYFLLSFAAITLWASALILMPYHRASFTRIAFSHLRHYAPCIVVGPEWSPQCVTEGHVQKDALRSRDGAIWYATPWTGVVCLWVTVLWWFVYVGMLVGCFASCLFNLTNCQIHVIYFIFDILLALLIQERIKTKMKSFVGRNRTDFRMVWIKNARQLYWKMIFFT